MTPTLSVMALIITARIMRGTLRVSVGALKKVFFKNTIQARNKHPLPSVKLNITRMLLQTYLIDIY